MKILNIFQQLRQLGDDPVRHCDVYREDGCSHVDGYLCDFETCDIRLEWTHQGLAAQKKNSEDLNSKNRKSCGGVGK